MNCINQLFYLLLLLQCYISAVYTAGILEGRQTKLKFAGQMSCSRGGIVQAVPVYGTSSHKAGCNLLIGMANYTAPPAPLVIRDREVLVPRNNPMFILDIKDGNILATWYFEIDDGICRGGLGFSQIKYEDTDPRACTSRHGLRLLEGIPISLKIRGGKCETECSGAVDIHFSPGLIDYGF